MPKLLGIARAKNKKEILEEIPKANITIDEGIIGDRRGSSNKRQVTVLFNLDWIDTCKELGKNIHWTNRRANLYVSDIRAYECSNRRILIGDVILRVNFETDPCLVMDSQHNGLMRALTPNWRGGVCCSVINGGTISIGDQVKLD